MQLTFNPSPLPHSPLSPFRCTASFSCMRPGFVPHVCVSVCALSRLRAARCLQIWSAMRLKIQTGSSLDFRGHSTLTVRSNAHALLLFLPSKEPLLSPAWFLVLGPQHAKIYVHKGTHCVSHLTSLDLSLDLSLDTSLDLCMVGGLQPTRSSCASGNCSKRVSWSSVLKQCLAR